MQLYSARQRRRLSRGLRRKQHSLLKRLRKAKKEAPPMEKPEVVKTHLRDMIILPEMVGSMVGVYNGKTFNQVEIKVRPRRCGVGPAAACAELCASPTPLRRLTDTLRHPAPARGLRGGRSSRLQPGRPQGHPAGSVPRVGCSQRGPSPHEASAQAGGSEIPGLLRCRCAGRAALGPGSLPAGTVFW